MDERSNRLLPLLVGVVFLDPPLPGDGPLTLFPDEFLVSCGCRRLSERDRFSGFALPDEEELSLHDPLESEALEREVLTLACVVLACLALAAAAEDSGWSILTAEANSWSKAKWDIAKEEDKDGGDRRSLYILFYMIYFL